MIAGIQERNAVRQLVTIRGSAGNRNGLNTGVAFQVLDGSYKYILGSSNTEQTAMLAALNKLPSSNIVTLVGGSYGGTATVSSHITTVTG